MAMKRVVTCCHDNQSFKLMGKHSASTSSLFSMGLTSTMGELHIAALKDQGSWGERQGRDNALSGEINEIKELHSQTKALLGQKRSWR